MQELQQFTAAASGEGMLLSALLADVHKVGVVDAQ
jgi:hypothetical protein